MSKRLRMALVVPMIKEQERVVDETAVRKMLSVAAPDLLVFPEACFDVQTATTPLAKIRGLVIKKVRSVADQYGVAVLAGVSVEVGGRWMECAGYWNPRAGRGETEEHFYAKHSTAPLLPYGLEDYTRERASLFEPIHLGDQRIGALICHDQFFARIPSQLAANGANLFIDLTGSDVVPSKWRNVLTARSVEFPSVWACTMSRQAKPGKSRNQAFACAYRNGAEIEAWKRVSGRTGDIVVVDTDGQTGPLQLEQAYSLAKETDSRIALHPSTASANVSVGQAGVAGAVVGQWKRTGGCDLLVLPAEELADPMAIHRHDVVGREVKNGVVCFVSASNVITVDKALLHARMRAIEHRVAIVVCTPAVREVVLASRYKNIQRAQEDGGVFRFHGGLLKGTFSALGATANQGIPREYQDLYGELGCGRLAATSGRQASQSKTSRR